ncbi:MAG: fibrobacter succinogenes major paralogous domain-containing protein [Bacteroidales bacterium]
MKMTSKFLIYPVLIISGGLLVFTLGCEKDDDDDADVNDNENGNDDIVFDIDYGSVTDIDDNEYKTIVIGGQEWMAENLKVTKYNNGDEILSGLSDQEWEDTTEGAYTVYPPGDLEGIDSEEEVVEAYGRLYNWYAVDDSRDICPSGWHVPSNYEWTQLREYLLDNYDAISSSNIGNTLKSCRQDGSPLGDDCDTRDHPRWNGHGTHYGTDDFGFSALPGGGRGDDGNFQTIGFGGYWWSSTAIGSDGAFITVLLYESGDLTVNGGDDRPAGFSVRCIKD